MTSLSRFKARVQDIFSRYDEDGNGVIDAKEFHNMLTAILGHEPQPELLDLVHTEMDTNKDGMIQLEELTKWYNAWRFAERGLLYINRHSATNIQSRSSMRSSIRLFTAAIRKADGSGSGRRSKAGSVSEKK